MKTIEQLTAAELEKVLELKKQIEAILSGKEPVATKVATGEKTGKVKKVMSAATKAKIAKAQRARWKKEKAGKK